jgi:hypothetical protein
MDKKRHLRSAAAGLALLSCPCLATQWVPVGTRSMNPLPVYIKPETVRQSGPMAIYRQVEELRNEAAPVAQGSGTPVGSVWQLVEYDCMQPRVRILKRTAFSGHWASGEEVPALTTVTPPNRLDWRNLADHPFALDVIREVCPGLQDYTP